MEKYSYYVVVGSGASGCALPNKLLNANQSVSLINTRYSHHNFLLDVPTMMLGLLCRDLLTKNII
jgi:hypothetical protein